MDDIEMAQVVAGESAVVERLRQKGLLPPPDSPPEDIAALDAMNRNEDRLIKRQHLEHSLATAFVEMQRSFKVEERQKHWFECLRLCAELEKLNATNTEKITDTIAG